MGTSAKKSKSTKRKPAKKGFFAQFLKTPKSKKNSKAIKIKVKRIKPKKNASKAKTLAKNIKAKTTKAKTTAAKAGTKTAKKVETKAPKATAKNVKKTNESVARKSPVMRACLFGSMFLAAASIVFVLLSTITVTRIESFPTEIQFGTVYKDDDALMEGETRMAQEGKNGIVNMEYEVTYRFLTGQEISRRLVSTTQVAEVSDEIVLRASNKKKEADSSSESPATRPATTTSPKRVIIIAPSNETHVDSNEHLLDVDDGYGSDISEPVVPEMPTEPEEPEEPENPEAPAEPETPEDPETNE